MILRKPIVALALGVLASTAVFIPNAFAHERVASTNYGGHACHSTVKSGINPRNTTRRTASALLTIPGVLTTATATLQDNTILPKGTVLLSATVRPAGTRLA